jgi:hypothetical protein
MTNNRMYELLAYAGALPFAACAVLLFASVNAIAGIGGWADVAASYGVAIVSFMAGVHWGTYLYRSSETSLNLLLISNAITVSVWLAFVFAPVTASLITTSVAFLLLLLVDYRLAGARLITPRYLTLRRNVTTIVVILLIVTALLA